MIHLIKQTSMDKRKYKQLLLPFLLIMLVLVGGGGCGDDEDYEGEYLKLIGSWKNLKYIKL